MLDEQVLENTFFENLRDEEIRELIDISKVSLFEDGEFLFKEGDESNSFYIIFSGNIEISMTHIENEDDFTLTIPAGSILGEIAFFDDSTRTASAMAKDSVIALSISKDSFDNLQERNPVLAIKLLKELGKILAERLRFTDQIIVGLTGAKISDNFVQIGLEENK